MTDHRVIIHSDKIAAVNYSDSAPNRVFPPIFIPSNLFGFISVSSDPIIKNV